MWVKNYLSAAIKGIVIHLAIIIMFIVVSKTIGVDEWSSYFSVIFQIGVLKYPPGIIALSLGPVIGIIAFKLKENRRVMTILIGLIAYFIVIYISILMQRNLLSAVMNKPFTVRLILFPAVLSITSSASLFFLFPSMITGMLVLERWTRPKNKMES
mgnify:CR=1 FL=1